MSDIAMSTAMTPAPDKRLRRFLFALTEVEASLRAAGRPAAAESISVVAGRSSATVPQDFLDECRTELVAVLLGERDLPVESIGQIMDALAAIDEILRGYL